MAEGSNNGDSLWLPRLALLIGLALGGVGGLGIGAVMFKLVEDPEPKVVDTYCSPFFREGLDDVVSPWPNGLGTQVRVLDDGSQYRVPSDRRVFDEDTFIYDGLCRTPVP